MDTKRGFTLVELAIAVVFVAITFVFFMAPTWNCFYTEEGVLKQLKAEGMVENNATIVRTERCLFAYSKIYVREELQPTQTDKNIFPGCSKVVVTKMFKLDTNILYNYKLMGRRFPRPSHITAPRIP